MDKATADSRLLFTEKETEGLYETVTNALSANKACNPEYLSPADLEDNKPSQPNGYQRHHAVPQHAGWPLVAQLDVQLLLPGNIALDRGDVVQLMYYPNIASGSTEGATKTIPQRELA